MVCLGLVVLEGGSESVEVFVNLGDASEEWLFGGGISGVDNII